MGKLIYAANISLDGFLKDETGSFDYLPFVSACFLLAGSVVQFVLAALESGRREQDEKSAASQRAEFRRINVREEWYRNGWVLLVLGSGSAVAATWPW